MKSIDKNDVNIAKLFAWGRPLTITNELGGDIVTVYIRLISDADLNKAKVFSLRKSAELRRKLYDLNSDERLAYIPDLDIVDKENLVEYALSAQIRDITTRVIKNLDLRYPPEPSSDASTEEQEKYQEQIDNWPAMRDAMISATVFQEMEAERQRLSNFSEGELKKLCEKYMIDARCEEEMFQRFKEMSVFMAIYKDDTFKERYFESFEQFKELPTTILDFLLNSYYELDLTMDDLKKSPEVMQ